MAVTDPVPVIEATLAPMFLVSGASIFLNFLQARLFRVSDRMRALIDHVSTMHPNDPRRAPERAHILALAKRQRLIRNALVLGVVAVALTALTAMLLIAPFVLGVAIPAAAAVVCFSLALFAFGLALVIGLTDAVTSVRMVELEVQGMIAKKS